MAKKQTSGNLALEQQRVIVIPAHDEIVARKLRVAAYPLRQRVYCGSCDSVFRRKEVNATLCRPTANL